MSSVSGASIAVLCRLSYAASGELNVMENGLDELVEDGGFEGLASGHEMGAD